jgi:hypothetical protein
MPKKLIHLLTALLFTSTVYAVDLTPPTTTYSINPTTPDGKNGWYVTPVGITLNATDLDSGVSSISYRLNGGSWITENFTETLNLAPNPSFEITDATSNINTQGWTARDPDANVTPYTRDSTEFLPGYENYSIEINANSGGWHWISNQGNYAVATPYSNMTAAAWIKTNAVEEFAGFDVYALLNDFSSVLLASSNRISGTNDWTYVSADYTVNSPNVLGVYLTIGVYGKGLVNIDSVTINDSIVTTSKQITVGTDGEYTIEYYSKDRANNIEIYNCAAVPAINCKRFKIDSTPPGNWHDSGAFRGLFGAVHELYVYTNVDDVTSGLSVFTDKYQYQTDKNPGSFGRFSDLLSCSSTWEENKSVILISPPFSPGVKSAYLLTPKTNFCNNDWKTCKTVKFHAEDMAGNASDKDYCINGPWVKIRGKGIVRVNNNIDMLSEPEDANTDGLTDLAGTQANYYTSSTNRFIRENTMTKIYDYNELLTLISATPTVRTSLTTASGVYKINGNYEIKNSNIPSGFSTTSFNQIYFIDGDLTISNNINISGSSTVAFVVSGNINIAKTVTSVTAALIASGNIHSAYNIAEGEASSTLYLRGLFSANRIILGRTLQGTNNADIPAEDFVYEPKYLTKLKGYFGRSSVVWVKE